MQHGAHVMTDKDYKFFATFLPFVYRSVMAANLYIQRLQEHSDSITKNEIDALMSILDGSDLYDDLNTMMSMLDLEGHKEFYQKYGGPEKIINRICSYHNANPFDDEDE